MTERRIRPQRDDYPMPHERRPVSRERWQRHRETLMLQEARDGRRPPEWWEYEKGMPQPYRQAQAATLYAMGELGESELAGVMKRWREHWERAQAPNFAYCIGHAKPGDTFATWIEGVVARKAHYHWAGIPPALILQWGRERRRTAAIVREIEASATKEA